MDTLSGVDFNQGQQGSRYPEEQIPNPQARETRQEMEASQAEANARTESHVTADCDACRGTKDVKVFLYCKECKQKLCNLCMVIHNRLGGTRRHYNLTGKCFTECDIVEKSVWSALLCRGIGKDLDQLSTRFLEDLGIQVCYNQEEEIIELRAPTTEVLELAMDTVRQMCDAEPDDSKVKKVVRHGGVEWILRGHNAISAAKLFQAEIKSLIKTYEIAVNLKYDDIERNWPPETNSRGELLAPQTHEPASLKTDMHIKSSFEHYYAIDCEIEEIMDEIHTLKKTEVFRPKQDEFRVKVYAIMKENCDDVICYVENADNFSKLVIMGRDSDVVENTKQEFLSLFCKECTACHREETRVTYFDCKHVLCHECVKTSPCLNGVLQCSVCTDTRSQRTPVASLQLQCIQVIDKMADRSQLSRTAGSVGTVRRQRSLRAMQLSTKIPRYLLNKWKKMTGGLNRLKSIIENTYGFRVAGPEDNMKIYGQQPEILELAVQSLERLNEKTPETGISQRLAEKCVEWRLRGDFARIAHFLFNKEVYGLKKKYSTVEIQAFTEIEPSVVDVKCGYVEYLKVKYEMEELENDIKNLYTDECIQPKTFYHNVKVQEYLRSKRRDTKIFCCLGNKSNVIAVTIRGRKKDHVAAAKEELLKL